MAVTIKDIAKRAGVSYSTVSRALNGIGSENTQRRQRILQLAREMGYVSGQARINSRLSRTYVIGLYFSTIGRSMSPFMFQDVLAGVYSVVGSKYNVVVKGIDMQGAGSLAHGCFDGVIALSERMEDTEFMEEAIVKKIPLVAICRQVDLKVPNVTTDEAMGMERAMDFLLENGHRRIGVIEGLPGLDSTRQRRYGWRSSMRRHGLNPDSVPVVCGNYRYTSGYMAAWQLLKYGPTALLCFNDEMAYGARAAVVERGMDVPGDVSLIGFGNWDVSGYSDLRLTTVERNVGEMAREGARALLRLMDEGIVDNRRIYLNNQLVIRDTVKNLNVEERNET